MKHRGHINTEEVNHRSWASQVCSYSTQNRFVYFVEILHVFVKACVCAGRGKSTLPDTLSQSQCYACSESSSSLATSEPPTHLSQHTARLQSNFVLRGDNSNLQLRFPTDFSKCSFLSIFWQKIFRGFCCKAQHGDS